MISNMQTDFALAGVTLKNNRGARLINKLADHTVFDDLLDLVEQALNRIRLGHTDGPGCGCEISQPWRPVSLQGPTYAT